MVSRNRARTSLSSSRKGSKADQANSPARFTAAGSAALKPGSSVSPVAGLTARNVRDACMRSSPMKNWPEIVIHVASSLLTQAMFSQLALDTPRWARPARIGLVPPDIETAAANSAKSNAPQHAFDRPLGANVQGLGIRLPSALSGAIDIKSAIRGAALHIAISLVEAQSGREPQRRFLWPG